jgi:hypothetical protein
MPYQLEDIVEVFDKIGLNEERDDGETAFPPVQKLIRRLDSVVNRRKRAERERQEALEEQENSRLDEEDRRLNPEKYAAAERKFQDRVAALNKKIGYVPKPTPPPPVMTACPRCEEPLPLVAGIRLLKGAEVIEMGQMMVKMEAQAAERREANLIHGTQCVEAEIAKANSTSTKDPKVPSTETK